MWSNACFGTKRKSGLNKVNSLNNSLDNHCFWVDDFSEKRSNRDKSIILFELFFSKFLER